MIKVYTSDVTTFITYFEENNQEALAKRLSLLSVDRKEKIEQCKRAGDKARSLGASLLLLYAYWQEKGEKTAFPELAYREYKKPYFAGEDKLFFSLSHSGKYVMCAISDNEIGCDIQEHRKVTPALLKKMRIDEEHFFEAWCKKEAYGKLTGEGIGALQEPIQEGQSPAKIQLQNVMQTKIYQIAPDYTAAICYYKGCEKP